MDSNLYKASVDDVRRVYVMRYRADALARALHGNVRFGHPRWELLSSKPDPYDGHSGSAVWSEHAGEFVAAGGGGQGARFLVAKADAVPVLEAPAVIMRLWQGDYQRVIGELSAEAEARWVEHLGQPRYTAIWQLRRRRAMVEAASWNPPRPLRDASLRVMHAVETMTLRDEVGR